MCDMSNAWSTEEVAPVSVSAGKSCWIFKIKHIVWGLNSICTKFCTDCAICTSPLLSECINSSCDRCISSSHSVPPGLGSTNRGHHGPWACTEKCSCHPPYWSLCGELPSLLAIGSFWWGGGGGCAKWSWWLFLVCDDFGKMFDNLFHTCAFFFFKAEISSCTPIPLFRPGSVHSGSVNWDDCDWVFPDKLCVRLLPDRFPNYAWTAA